MRTRKSQHGITLVEILVTVVIISVGLLGVAALHLTSLRSGQGAHVRAQATAFASDIIDRMRANPQAAANKEYNIAIADNAATTPVGLVAIDKQQWLDALAEALPGGDGSVVQGTLAGRTIYTVTVQWVERETKDEKTPPNTFVTIAEL